MRDGGPRTGGGSAAYVNAARSGEYCVAISIGGSGATLLPDAMGGLRGVAAAD